MTLFADNYLKRGVDTFILLDFDGVINVDPVAGDPSIYTDAYTDRSVVTHYVRDSFGDTTPYKLHWSPTLVDHLSDILSNPRVNLLWLTTWRTHIIPVYEDVLKLSWANRPHVFDYASKFTDTDSIYGKTTAVSDFIDSIAADSGVRVAWVDDVLVPHHLNHYHLTPSSGVFDLDDVDDAHLFDRLPVDDFLAIGPNPSIGLRPSDIDKLRSFVDRV